jgi:hypothetical protein
MNEEIPFVLLFNFDFQTNCEHIHKKVKLIIGVEKGFKKLYAKQL